jgi:pimeloyl-ACP methyl ester carboxylesterase
MMNFVSLRFLLICFIPAFCYAQEDTLISGKIIWQSLTFQSANGQQVPYDYGILKVPENRPRKNSRLIELAVMRLRRQMKNNEQVPSSHPVLFLSGGPGESGINYIREEYFQRLAFKLQEDADVILLDQRGTGRSRPSLGYPLPLANNKSIFLSPARAIKLTEEAAAVGEAAYKKNGTDIHGYNSLQSAADIRDLKIALGVEKISILGISYGTHLALATAKTYPLIVDKMALVGVSGLNDIHHFPANYDSQLQKISALAAADSGINHEVPDMIALLKSVLHDLELKPIELSIKNFRARRIDTIPIGKFGLQLILRLDAGDSHDFVYFPALLYGLKHGDYRLLQQYAERRFNQFNGGSGSGIFAMRQASGATAARYDLIKKQGKTSLLGNSMNTPDIYAGWSGVDLGDEYRAPFKCDLPTLFVSGSLDSNTPVSNVDQMIGNFSKAAHLIVQYAGHEDLLPAIEVQAEIEKFMSTGKTQIKSISLDKPVFVPVF